MTGLFPVASPLAVEEERLLFDDGLGMFDSMVMGQIYQAASGKVTPNMYTINSAMDGSQFIYGVQLGLSYKVNDWLGVFADGRMNYFSGGYEGFLTAKVKADLPGVCRQVRN